MGRLVTDRSLCLCW